MPFVWTILSLLSVSLFFCLLNKGQTITSFPSMHLSLCREANLVSPIWARESSLQLNMNMVVVAGGVAACGSDLTVVQTEPAFEVRLEEDLADLVPRLATCQKTE